MFKQYRCTRNALYLHDCIGKKNLSARQGYYIKAKSEDEAIKIMEQRFPSEAQAGFTVEKW